MKNTDQMIEAVVNGDSPSSVLEGATDYERTTAKAVLDFIHRFSSLKKEIVAAFAKDARHSAIDEFREMWWSTTATKWGTSRSVDALKHAGVSSTDIDALMSKQNLK